MHLCKVLNLNPGGQRPTKRELCARVKVSVVELSLLYTEFYCTNRGLSIDWHEYREIVIIIFWLSIRTDDWLISVAVIQCYFHRGDFLPIALLSKREHFISLCNGGNYYIRI